MFKTPSHSYYVALTVRGIRGEARAASITVACDYAVRDLLGNRKADENIAAAADRMVRQMVHLRRTTNRGALRTKITERGASIEITMDSRPKNWAEKTGPANFERTNWDSVRANGGVVRWK